MTPASQTECLRSRISYPPFFSSLPSIGTFPLPDNLGRRRFGGERRGRGKADDARHHVCTFLHYCCVPSLPFAASPGTICFFPSNSIRNHFSRVPFSLFSLACCRLSQPTSLLRPGLHTSRDMVSHLAGMARRPDGAERAGTGPLKKNERSGTGNVDHGGRVRLFSPSLVCLKFVLGIFPACYCFMQAHVCILCGNIRLLTTYLLVAAGFLCFQRWRENKETRVACVLFSAGDGLSCSSPGGVFRQASWSRPVDQLFCGNRSRG